MGRDFWMCSSQLEVPAEQRGREAQRLQRLGVGSGMRSAERTLTGARAAERAWPVKQAWQLAICSPFPWDLKSQPFC